VTALLVALACLAPVAAAALGWWWRGRCEAQERLQIRALNAVLRGRIDDAARTPRPETAQKLAAIRADPKTPPTTLRVLEAELAKPDDWREP